MEQKLETKYGEYTAILKQYPDDNFGFYYLGHLKEEPRIVVEGKTKEEAMDELMISLKAVMKFRNQYVFTFEPIPYFNINPYMIPPRKYCIHFSVSAEFIFKMAIKDQGFDGLAFKNPGKDSYKIHTHFSAN